MSIKSGPSIKTANHIRAMIFILLPLILSTNTGYATTVKYFLNNVIQDNGLQMTGTFHWTYTEGDFENGTEVFTDLYIPKSRAKIDEFTITFEITHFLLDPLSSAYEAILDLSRSENEIAGAGRGAYKSGAIMAGTNPISFTMWIFISSLLGLFGYFNFTKQKQ